MKVAKSGREAMESLFRHPELALGQMPVLKDAFTNMAAACADGLRELCPVPATLLVNKVDSEGVWDLLERYEGGVAFIYFAPNWGARVVVGLDRRAIFALVEATYGGEGGGEATETERPLSQLEIALASSVAGMAAASLKSSLGAVSPTDLILERTEVSIDFMMMGQSDFQVAAAQIVLQIMERGGQLFVFLPHAVLHPIRKKLQRAGGESVEVADPGWTQRLTGEIKEANVELKASMNGGSSMLSSVAALKVGSIIELPPGEQNNVTISTQDVSVFSGRLAQAQGRYAVELEGKISRR